VIMTPRRTGCAGALAILAALAWSGCGSGAGAPDAGRGGSPGGGSATGGGGAGGAPATSGAGGATGGGAGSATGTGGLPATGGRGGAAGVPAGGQAGGGAGGAGGGAGAKGKVTAAPGATLVKVDPTARRQTFEGWGTSLCWWANHVGSWSAAARNAVVDALVDPTGGLGYNVFRYNIGGGDDPSHHHMRQWGDIPGFEPSKGTWDWTADANQRAVLQRIVARLGAGAILEAFSNSPPYWMTKSGCSSGSADGSNNLQDGSYADFADYLTEVVRHYRDAWGITFRTLEPLNEPNATWWTANGSQEGCHFDPASQQQIVKALGGSLTAKGLADTTVSASDENSVDDAVKNLQTYDAAALAAMSQMNTHTYSAGSSARASLRALAAKDGKRLWQSETGPLSVTLNDTTDAALFMAGRIMTDLRDLQPNAWVDWQFADPSQNWASITVNDAQQTWAPLKRFYLQAGFSRFIRPGAVTLALAGPDMVGALAPDGQSIVVVVRNGDPSAAESFTFDLTALDAVGAQVAVYRTSRTEDLAALAPIPVAGWSFTAALPAYSVTTLVIPLR
jgi:O-glycosyl hydrolase